MGYNASSSPYWQQLMASLSPQQAAAVQQWAGQTTASTMAGARGRADGDRQAGGAMSAGGARMSQGNFQPGTTGAGSTGFQMWNQPGFLTPDQKKIMQSAMTADQGASFGEGIRPVVYAALAAAGGAYFGGAGAAGGEAGAAGGTGDLMASAGGAVPGAVSDSGMLLADGTVVPASGAVGDLGAFTSTASSLGGGAGGFLGTGLTGAQAAGIGATAYGAGSALSNGGWGNTLNNANAGNASNPSSIGNTSAGNGQGSIGQGLGNGSGLTTNVSPGLNMSGSSWWNSLNWGDILKSGGSILSDMYTGKQNANAAQAYANATAFKPTNVTGPGGQVTWNNGAPTTSLNPQGQGLMTGAGSLAGQGLNNLAQGNYANAGGYLGVTDPLFQQAQNTQNVLGQQAPTMAPGQEGNYNALMNNTAMNAAGLMNGGGPNSFNQDWNTNYTNTLQNLRDTQQFGNTQAAQHNLNSLFGSGILNSSAGTSVMQGFANSLNQQDAQNQLNAMQNANQQSQLGVQNAQANLGIGAGYLNNYGNMQNNAYSQYNNAYNMAGQRSQQNLQNFMNLFQQGNNAQNQQYNQNTGLFTNGLNGYQAMDTSALNWLNQSGVLGGRASAANANAFMPGLNVAYSNNNNINAGVNSFLSNANLGGLFKGNG